MKNLVLLLFSLIVFGCAESSSSKPTKVNVSSKSKFVSESIRVDKSNKVAWTLKGLIRNNSPSAAKGSVKIKFLSGKGDILHTGRAFVNGNDPIQRKQAAPFEYSTSPSNFEGVEDYEVTFQKR